MPDFDRMRAERDFMNNPPISAPGQGDDGWGDLFNQPAQDTTSGSPMGGDVDINSILNGQGGMPGAQGMGGMPGIPGQMGGIQGQFGTMPGQPQQTFGDKVSEGIDKAAVASAKGIWEYTKYIFKAFQNNTKNDWNALGAKYFKVSVIVLAVGLVIFLLRSIGVHVAGEAPLMVEGIFGSMTGLLIAIFNPKEKVEEVEEPIVQDTTKPDVLDDMAWDDGYSDDYDDADGYSEDEDWGSEDSYDSFDEIDDSLFASNDNFNAVEAASNLPDIPEGQYTRQFLFETFSKVLPLVNPNFMQMESVSDTEDEFLTFEDYLYRAAGQTGAKEEKLEELQMLEMHKNLFLIRLIATRPTGLKEKEIADGVADLYKRDEYGTAIEGREGVFGRVNSQVGKMIIDIFLSKNVMVSLGDVFRQKSDFLLDINNTMPLIWGVSEMGKVFCYDGMKDGNGGMLISGEARSGKSWKGQSLIAQMCMFRSPKELNFYFYDVKGIASDYAYLSKVLPHCKGFCGEALRFNESIESILNRENKRRTALLAGKYTNVKDYNKDHPYEKIPTTYFVIDEMATAMSEMMDKDIEIRKKFDSLLKQIATKYPYLELKLLLFPHRIVNDIINKTVSSMISTRSVMGNVPAEELKNALDVKNFQYSLVKTGDMAIKSSSINSGNVVYSHSEVLSTNEQTNRKIFDYIGAVWKRLEPDCFPMQLDNSVSAVNANGDNGGSQRTRKPARDNAVFEDDFSYTSKSGRASGSSDFVGVGDLDTEFSGSSDVDESFWDKELGESDSKSFWDNFS